MCMGNLLLVNHLILPQAYAINMAWTMYHCNSHNNNDFFTFIKIFVPAYETQESLQAVIDIQLKTIALTPSVCSEYPL